MVPRFVSMVAVYFLDPSICIEGGAENCLGAEEDTGAPWAAGEAEAAAGEAEGDGAGFGKGLTALEIWAAEGGVAGGRVGVAATGAAFWPQPITGNVNKVKSASRNRRLKRGAPMSDKEVGCRPGLMTA
jgi:hypothetical protein